MEPGSSGRITGMHYVLFFLFWIQRTSALPFYPWKLSNLGYCGLETNKIHSSNDVIKFSRDQLSLFVQVIFESYNERAENLNLNDWVTWQSNQSFHFLLQNIGGILSYISQADLLSGLVVASPLRSHPNYFFNWIRDSALAVRTLIHKLEDQRDEPNKSIKSAIELYIEVNYYLQRRPNKSGRFDDERRSGLGEPKYMPNGESFTETWGRPQSDGPALRIITIVRYLDYLHSICDTIDSVSLSNGSHVYHSVIKPDLEYVIKNWKLVLFDLWEEVSSFHFYNALVQLKSLQDGMNLASILDGDKAFLRSLKDNFEELGSFILDYETGFQSHDVPYIVETPSLIIQGKRIGLDAAALLASLHAHNTNFQKEEHIPFDIDDSRILNTITAMVADMKFRYPINHKYLGKTRVVGVGLGRYPEDVYDGYATTEGNPWFICTASASEILYKLVYKRLVDKSDLVILPDNREFYSLFDGSLLLTGPCTEKTLLIEYGSHRYKKTLKSILDFSDTFMEVIRDHIDAGGHMLEQFNKYTGFMQGARDLTWSYSSLYSSIRWRTKAQQLLERFAY